MLCIPVSPQHAVCAQYLMMGWGGKEWDGMDRIGVGWNGMAEMR